MRARWRAGLAAVVLLAMLAGGAIAIRTASAPEPAATLRAGAYDPPRAAPEFALPGSDGSTVTLARYRGKVVLLTFGFTYCAAVCPTTLATLAQAREALGAEGNAVQAVFVTVDPERDTTAQMREYLAAFDKTFVGVTGTPAQLAAVREGYGVTARKEGSGDNYAMAHTSSIFLIDREGRLRAMMPFGREADDFAHDIALLLKE